MSAARRRRSAPGRRARVGDRDQPAGDPRLAARPGSRGGGRPSPPTSPRRRRSSGRAAAGVTTGVFERSAYADRESARPGDRRLARGLGASSSSFSPATCSCSPARSSAASARRGSSTSTRRCFPRSRGSTRSGRRSRTGSGCTGVTVHFVDEGVDTGPILLQRPVELDIHSAGGGDRASEIHRGRARAAAPGDRADRGRGGLVRPGEPAARPDRGGLEPRRRRCRSRSLNATESRTGCGSRRALISVSDKSGVVEFARGLSRLGIEIISTGGTASGAARGRRGGAHGRGADRGAGDPRRPGQDAPPEDLRGAAGDARQPRPPGDDRGARGSSRSTWSAPTSTRSSRRSPAATSPTPRRSRTSTSAGRR